MLKLPFFNRERYVLLKAYTFDRRLVEKTPITIGSKADTSAACPYHGDEKEFKQAMSSCYGNVLSLKRSATLPAWSEFIVDGKMGSYSYTFPRNHFTTYEEVPPIQTNMPPNMGVTKLFVPWHLSCNKKDIQFVYARHILNNTPMMPLTGIIGFNYGAGIHIFNAIAAESNYRVKYKTPLMSLFPLTDLPFYVEAYEDKEEFNALYELQFSFPYLNRVGIKEYLEKK